MTAKVLDFHKPSKPEPSPEYYCMRCNADTFKLASSGAVICAVCASIMRNLKVLNAPQS